MCKFMCKVHVMHYVRLCYVNTIMQLLYAITVISMRTKRLRKAQIEYQITHLGTIVTRDFDEALVAINDREVDDLGVC